MEVVLVLPFESSVLTGVANTAVFPWTLSGPWAAAPLAAQSATIAAALSTAAACTFLMRFLSLASFVSCLFLLVLLLLRTEKVRGEGGGARPSSGGDVLETEEVLDGAEDRVRIECAAVRGPGRQEL